MDPTLLKTWSAYSTEIERIVKVLAILAAGAWAYYHYFRGRTYRPRLEPTVTGEILTSSKGPYLRITASIKNNGLSRADITQDGTCIVVYSSTGDAKSLQDMDWEQQEVIRVFTEDAGIESGDNIHDKILLRLPALLFALRLQLRVVSGDSEWSAWDITITEPLKKDTQSS